MNRLYIIALVVISTIFVGCQADLTNDNQIGGNNTLTLSISGSRTSLGEKVGDTYPICWCEEDKIAVNGIVSSSVQIDANEPSKATFEFNKVISYPYNITYPYCEATSAEQPIVVLPTEQSYTEGSFSNGSAPMCGYATDGNNIAIKHLASVMRIPVKSAIEGVILEKIVVSSPNKIAGEFSVNCQNAQIVATANSANSITYTTNIALSTSEEKIFHIAIPAVDAGACTVELFDSNGGKMVVKWNAGTIQAGIVREFKALTHKVGTECVLEPLGVEYDSIFATPIYGYVKDTNGNPLEGVVVSDGVKCVKTDKQGFYAMTGDLATVKFIMISTPSGYKVPNDSKGMPMFYHRVTTEEVSKDLCEANFTLTPISGNPNRYTMLVGADPQPRARTAGYDRIAYQSLDICEDLYLDMQDTRAAITDREVYGMMLGDIVHENMALFANYVAGIGKTGVQMFNIIGNHDHDLSATTDEEGARRFEDNFGPSYYSFNIGKQHFVVLDNVIMTVIDGQLKKNEYTYGLTDKQWQWLQNDLSFVDKSTTLMVASHIPMFKKDSADAEFQDQSDHGSDYANLLAQYSKVHAWAGHTHRSFNYNYPSSNKLKNIEVHTLARSTGELWTNEYNAYGTPRGYTIVEVDGDNISWKFKPTTYQKAQFVGNQYSTVGTPAYTYRDWNYNAEGVAIMKNGGNRLDSNYQMKAWKQGSYIYVHVFMYDNKWGNAKFNGEDMTLLKRHYNFLVENPRDYAYQEIFDFYSVNNPTLASAKESGDYTYSPVYHNSIFRTYVSGSGTGTITITDRFGNNYSTTISY